MIVVWFIFALYILGGLAVLAGLIYVISKRIKDRKNEDFEQRSN